MRHRSFDLVAVVVLVFLALALPELGNRAAWLRAPVGILLACVLPGYAIVQAVFITMRASVGWLLAIVTSMSLAIVGAFGINLLPAGMTTETWTAFFAIVTLTAAAIAYVRRAWAAGAAAKPSPDRLTWLPTTRPEFVQIGLLLMTVVIIGGTLAYSRSVSGDLPHDDIFQLWMLPDSDNRPDHLKVGVRNINMPTQYLTFRLERDGYLVKEWNGIQVATGQTWEQDIVLPEYLPGTGELQGKLIRTQEPSTVFREVALSISR